VIIRSDNINKSISQLFVKKSIKSLSLAGLAMKTHRIHKLLYWKLKKRCHQRAYGH
jgi:hypothetical protein